MLHRLSGWLRSLRHRGQAGETLDEELRFHLDAQTAKNIRAGMTPDEARRQARLRFGAVQATREAAREQYPGATTEQWLRDLRFGLRMLRRAPSFSLSAIGTLALAIGATTTVFSVVDAVILQPPPGIDVDRVVVAWAGSPDSPGRPDYLTVEAWRRGSGGLVDLAIADPITMTFGGAEGAERIAGARVSPSLFSVLGVRATQGRLFTEEDAEARQAVAIVSHEFWQARFGGADPVVGTVIELDGRPSTIIGVLAEGLRVPLLAGTDVWEPHTLFPDWDERRSAPGAGSWLAVGRLGPGQAIEQAQGVLSARSPTAPARAPVGPSAEVTLVPLEEYAVAASIRLALWMLLGAVACVLIVATANVGGLALARGVGRAREVAVRAALGASRGRIVRQLLAEGMALAALAGAFGMALAVGGTWLARTFGPADVPRLGEVSVDARMLAFTVAVSLAAGVLVSLAPAGALFRRSEQPAALSQGRGASQGMVMRRTRRALVVAEVALAVVLLVSAGLLIRSWTAVSRVDMGFAPEGVLSINLTTGSFDGDVQRSAFYADVLEQVAAVPGVERAGLTGELFTDGAGEPVVTAELATASPEVVRLRVDEISDDLLATLRVPLLRGRFFSREDRPDGPPVALVNEAMARRVWPGRDPVGTRFKFGPRDGDGPWITVVGVVGDMRRQGPEMDPLPQVFVPVAQRPGGNMLLLVRTSTDMPQDLAGAVQAAVRRVNRDVPLYGVTTIETQVGDMLEQRRVQTWLLTAFSVVALLMAAVGLYGLIHYSVASRTLEIGIRMAAGARPVDIARTTVGEALVLGGAGLLLGLAAAFVVARAIAGLLYGVTGTDPVTFLGISLLLCAVVAAAAYLPTRRALGIEPALVLSRP